MKPVAMGAALAALHGGVVVLGDVMTDVVVTVGREINRGSDTDAQIRHGGGGSAANTACWLGVQGVATGLIAGIGNDPNGAEALALLKGCNVVHMGPVVDGVATGTCVVLVDPSRERTMFPDRGANRHLDRFDLDALKQARPARLHVSGYSLLCDRSRPVTLQAMAWARHAGIVVSLDAASAAPLNAVGADAFLDWSAGVDEMFANADEVEALGGQAQILRACRALIDKHGSDGATWTNGREEHWVPARPVAAVDSTGAGDAFAAGWLAAALTRTTVPQRLSAAADLAGLAVSRVGARPDPATLG